MDFPWSVLEISPTDDVSSIRRAYARKLKTTRPDEDQKAFEFLVQARDLALDLAKGEGQFAFLRVEEHTSPAETPLDVECDVAHPVVFTPPYGVSLPDHETANVEARLHELLLRYPEATDVEIWHEILKETDKLSLLRRIVFEDVIIRQLFAILISFDEKWEEGFRKDRVQSIWARRRWLRKHGKSIRDQRQEFGLIILAFSDAFGWANSDQAFNRALMDRRSGLIFSEALHYIRKQATMIANGLPERYDAKGLPVFADADVNALISPKVHKCGPFFKRALDKLEHRRLTGRWPLDYWFSGGFLITSYLLGFCQKRHFWVWVASFLFLLGAAYFPLPAALSGYRAEYKWVLFMPLLICHLLMVFYGYRSILAAWQAKILHVDQLQIFDPLLRFHYLRSLSVMQIYKLMFGVFIFIFYIIVIMLIYANLCKNGDSKYLISMAKEYNSFICSEKLKNTNMTLLEKSTCYDFKKKCNLPNIEEKYKEACSYYNACSSDKGCLRGGPGNLDSFISGFSS